MGSSPSHMDVSGCHFPRGFTGAWRAGGAWPESQTGAWPESTGAWPDKSISKIKIKESKKQKNIKKKVQKRSAIKKFSKTISSVKKCSKDVQ